MGNKLARAFREKKVCNTISSTLDSSRNSINCAYSSDSS